MRVLLDTHALLWAVSEPQKLSAAARDAISDRSNALVVSAASAWEIATKFRIGKLPHAEPIVQNFRGMLERLGSTALPIAPEHALLAGTLDWPHRDPFDRMLAAQSVLENLPLVTADPVFSGVEAVRVLW